MYYLVILIFSLFSMKLFADHTSVTIDTGYADAVITISGTTLPQGKFVAGASVQNLVLKELSDERLELLGAADEDVHSISSLLNLTGYLAYGLTGNLTLGLSFPYVERNSVRESHHHMGMGEVELAGDSEGMGDLSIFSKYRVFSNKNIDAALLFGVKTPSGDTGETRLGGLVFEAEQQPGTGSWDPFLGVSFSRDFGKTGLSGNLLYTISGEGTQNTDLGDTFNYNVAVSYRSFSPESEHDRSIQKQSISIIDYIDFILELNGDFKEKLTIDGHEEFNSGGHIIYFSPGFRLSIAHSWSLYGSAGVPIMSSMYGVQSEPEYRIFAGLSKSFDIKK